MRLHTVSHHFSRPFLLSSTPHSLSLKHPILPPFSLIRAHSSTSASIRARAMRSHNLVLVKAAENDRASNSAIDFEDSSLGNGYCLPPPEIRDIVDAPPLPMLSFSPLRDKILFLKRRSLPPLAELARPELKLAGVRIDGKSNSRSRMSFYTGIGIHQIMEDGNLGPEIEIYGFPTGAKLNFVTWSNDGSYLAFSVRTDEMAAVAC